MKQIINLRYFKQTLLVLTLCFSLSLSLKAAPLIPPPETKSCCTQQRPRQGDESREQERERFMRDLSAYISREAGFTEKESKKFFPVFFEMREKMRSLEHQKSRALRLAAEKNMNERDSQRVLEETARLDKKSLRIEAQYMERLRKMVGARKLLKAIDADRSFGRKVFKQMTKKKG